MSSRFSPVRATSPGLTYEQQLAAAILKLIGDEVEVLQDRRYAMFVRGPYSIVRKVARAATDVETAAEWEAACADRNDDAVVRLPLTGKQAQRLLDRACVSQVQVIDESDDGLDHEAARIAGDIQWGAIK